MGTALKTQEPSDCLVIVCDGEGHSMAVTDDLDAPSDENECTHDQCSTDPIPLPAGTPCLLGVCDQNAICVECLDTTGCTLGEVCKDSVCVPPSCADLVKDGGESDVDCGGPECGACDPGHNCGTDLDCKSGSICMGGVCQ